MLPFVNAAAESPEHAPAAERHAGLILSIVFHIALFALMLNGTLARRIAAPEAEAIRVTLNSDPPPPPEPLAVAPSPPMQLPLPAAATVSDAISIVDEQQNEPPGTEPEPAGLSFGENGPKKSGEATPRETPAETDSAASPASKSDEERRAEEDAYARALADGPEEAARAVNAQTDGTGSAKIADRLQAASMRQKSRKWLTTTKGAEEGIIRSMDISDAPKRDVDAVFDRYGIKIMVKQLNDPDGGGYNFLNQAKTAQGTFHSSAGSGVFQVFTYSGPAVARMMQLEVEEIKRRGFDPASSRIVEVEFGVVRTTRGYDLGVRSIDIVPIPTEEGIK